MTLCDITAGLFWKLSTIQLVSCSYILLKLMWLKFLVMWRFFRLWALADGVDPPENMTRCMSNNYSIEMFWKGWHSSFNKWIVRLSSLNC
jgi:D-alanyl-lipoteichoic acid acyltransferase DltB (MBOAT superfamily)